MLGRRSRLAQHLALHGHIPQQTAAPRRWFSTSVACLHAASIREQRTIATIASAPPAVTCWLR
jgi:hypothetical protein